MSFCGPRGVVQPFTPPAPECPPTVPDLGRRTVQGSPGPPETPAGAISAVSRSLGAPGHPSPSRPDTVCTLPGKLGRAW
jgi:hypothetical protein